MDNAAAIEHASSTEAVIIPDDKEEKVEDTSDKVLLTKNCASGIDQDAASKLVENDNDLLQAEDVDASQLATSTSYKGSIFSHKDPSKVFFLRKLLAPLKAAPLFCKSCQKEGHRNRECISSEIEKLVELHQQSKSFFGILDRYCQKVFHDNMLTDNEYKQRYLILQMMESHLRKFFPSCRLSLFGSSVNSFGFRGSDLDICMQLGTNQEAPIDLDYSSMVVKVAKALDRNRDIHKVMYIKSAKVPIVKFVIQEVNLEGDISLYNCLALKNSQMLACYGTIDVRVRILGYTLKVYAKTCEIGDASRGSLSSYAYVLLLLYYLQRCSPPVIPVLQEIYDRKKGKPDVVTEGWNTWYYGDINNLHSAWAGCGKNKQSVGELWLGFFRFYLEKFDFARNVISMKQIKTLSKFQKSWTHSTMSIEDPFNLNHNLAGGITRNMFNYIMSCFKRARIHYGTESKVKVKNSTVEDLNSYFFNHLLLTGNKHVPKDRLCHRCGRIGHTVANCAEKIVADRERRRHDSEKTTYSSENGDSDSNSKGKGSEKHIKCFTCQKYGHRAANCPQKMNTRTPTKDRHVNGREAREARERRDSNKTQSPHRRDINRSKSYDAPAVRDSRFQIPDSPSNMSPVVQQSQDNTIGVQEAVEMHPMENIEIAMPRSEILNVKSKAPGPDRRKGDRKWQMKAGAIQGGAENHNINKSKGRVHDPRNDPQGRVHDIAGVNTLFANFSPRQSHDPDEKTTGYQFPVKTTENFGLVQAASPSGVSFLQTANSPHNTSSILPAPADLSNQSFPTSQSDFPELSGGSPRSPGFQARPVPSLMDLNLTDQPGMQGIPAGNWNARSPGMTGFQQISSSIHGSPLKAMPADYTNIGTPSKSFQQTSPQGHHADIRSAFGRGNGSPAHNSPSRFHATAAAGREMKVKKQQPSTPPGLMQNIQWAQAPSAQPGWSPVTPNSDNNNALLATPTSTPTATGANSFNFNKFADNFNSANSPPKGNNKLSKSTSRNSEISDVSSPMRYDEEYKPGTPGGPANPQKQQQSSSTRKKGRKKGKNGGHP